MNRVILHVDMDAFFTSVEQHDRPELKGAPVVVGAPPDRRGVVAAASYEARRFGIRSAMPSREAGRRCPHAVFLPPRMKRYEDVSRQVFAILERFTPFVEPLSIDEAFLDVTGARRLHGSGPAIAAKIRAAIRAETGLTASVGVAPNKFLAKMASDMHKPDGLTVVSSGPAEIRAFLAPLPVGRLWGVGRVTQAHLERAGLYTIGDLQRADPERMRRILGAHGAAHLRRLAMGEDDRDVQTEWEEKSISREHTFDEDCANRGEVEATLLGLVDSVGRRLRAAGRHASTARLKLRWGDFRTLTRQQPLQPPCCDDFRLRAVAMEMFTRIDPQKPVRLIGFGVCGFDRPASQPDLFGNVAAAEGRRERLSLVMDEIRREYGGDSIGLARAGAPVRRSTDPRHT